ncbi:sulfatase [Edwardsiella piscicida]|uniref:sulfatase family protein n=1 Tax=Edwardsiella piscicida TaxID=1263550 RepID=UPI00370D6BEB
MSLSRREFLQRTAGGMAGVALGAPALAAGDAPAGTDTGAKMPPRNIVIITADQLARRGVGGYGNPQVNTPAIDSLIARGTRFEQAYCPYPLCAPSRACYWTGRLPHQTGVIANDSPNVPQDMVTLGELFSQAGYECRHFGKRHDYGALKGFTCADQVELPYDSPAAYPVDYDTREDVYCLQESLKYIDTLKGRDSDAPFMLAIEFNNPHNINGWTGAFAGPHGDIDGLGPLPPLLDNFDTSADLPNRPLAIQYACCTHNRVMQAANWNELNFRQYLKAYYHFTELADGFIGQVLSALRASGHADDTLVVFFADHGDAMGAHRLVAKMNWFYEESTNVPLVFAGPGIRPQASSRHLTSLCDLLPTLCDYAGLTPPPGLYGRSLMPILRGEQPDGWRDEVITQWNTDRNVDVQPARMLRTERYKYILYKENEEDELYDLQQDPGETRNLAHSPAHQAERQALRARFDEYVRNQVDPFYSQEAIIDRRWRSHLPGYHNHQGQTSIQVYQKEIRPLIMNKEFEKAREVRLALYRQARASYNGGV